MRVGVIATAVMPNGAFVILLVLSFSTRYCYLFEILVKSVNPPVLVRESFLVVCDVFVLEMLIVIIQSIL